MVEHGNIDEAKARGNIYSLLSRVFIREVDGELLDILKRGESIEAFRGYGFSFPNNLLGRREGEILDELAVEFASLFLITPGRLLSPYESVQAGKEGWLGGDASSKALLFYKKAGFTTPEAFPLFPDHFAIELEFMGHLCGREALALESRDEGTARSERGLQREFIKSHLGNWYDRFLTNVENASQHPFYKEFSSFAKGFLCSEIECLDSTTEN